MSLFKGKTLLITGGTGSFGNAVLNRFLKTDIGEIRVFSRDEKKQDDMRHEFQAKMPEVADKIRFYIGDVRDIQSVKNAMHGVDYIFHAAALKQVPSCEFFPIEAVKTMGYNRMIVAFQPHTYTRTKALFSEFVEQLRKPDLVVLGEIYAAREQNLLGISSMDLQKEIPGSVYCQTLPEITEYLRNTIGEGDVVLTVGAGDIFRVGDALIN